MPRLFQTDQARDLNHEESGFSVSNALLLCHGADPHSIYEEKIFLHGTNSDAPTKNYAMKFHPCELVFATSR